MPSPVIPESRSPVSRFVIEHSGQNPARCYQCGKCTAGCPAAPDMDMGPRQVMRALQLGMGREVLSCNSIWVCLQCQTCSSRCPKEIDIAKVMESLRLMAILEGHPAAEKNIALFNEVFLDVVKRHGRAYELEMGALYNLRSGHPTANARILVELVAKGRLALLPPAVRGVAKVRRLFDEAEAARRRVGREVRG
ncbi:MAG: 4Fe-4S dicluster domain-containing protein [Chloroflexi bacterium]|nr:4Fe-4S dicluster domain-containing protein [Chloroflexota bacterium]